MNSVFRPFKFDKPRSSRSRVRGRNAERGASLVEYAFVAILFLSLLFGISGFGHALFVYHHLNNAAREATRYAAVRGSKCSDDSSCAATNSASGIAGPTNLADVQAYVQSITPPSINAASLTVTACGISGQAACAASPPICKVAVNGVGPRPANYPGCTVQVQVQYAYNFVFPLIQTNPVNLSSSSDLIIAH
jgi:Flp pilus assembly protein TadG